MDFSTWNRWCALEGAFGTSFCDFLFELEECYPGDFPQTRNFSGNSQKMDECPLGQAVSQRPLYRLITSDVDVRRLCKELRHLAEHVLLRCVKRIRITAAFNWLPENTLSGHPQTRRHPNGNREPVILLPFLDADIKWTISIPATAWFDLGILDLKVSWDLGAGLLLS